MKVLVFLLVLGNLLFYAFSAGYLGHPDNPDAARVDQQITPERLRGRIEHTKLGTGRADRRHFSRLRQEPDGVDAHRRAHRVHSRSVGGSGRIGHGRQAGHQGREGKGKSKRHGEELKQSRRGAGRKRFGRSDAAPS